MTMGSLENIWVDICSLTDIPQRGARVIKAPSGCIAVFRTHDDAVFALDDKCPHQDGPLSQGIVHDRSVTCPLHNLVISLETGRAKEDIGSAQCHATEVKDGRVRIKLPAIIPED